MQSNKRRHRLFALAGGFLLVAIALLSLVQPQAVLAGWLTAFLFWSGIPLGALFLLMMMRLIAGRWTEWLEAPASIGVLLLPVAVFLVLPVLAWSQTLYPWAAGTEKGAFKAIYLTPWFFAARSLLFFSVASFIGWLVLSRGPQGTTISIIGLIALTLLHGLITTDLVTSLDPDFHSSAFGVYFLSCQVLIGLCVLALVAILQNDGPPVIPARLVMTGIMLWAYFAFLPYFILWSGNLPPGAAWYARRGAGVWNLAEYAIGILHLAPCFLLLFPPVQRSRKALVAIIACVMAGKAIEMAWLILPELDYAQMFAACGAAATLIGFLLVSPLYLRTICMRMSAMKSRDREALP